MGKLHKLRKTIKENPNLWIRKGLGKHYAIDGACIVRNKKGQTFVRPPAWNLPGYRKFIEHVLRELGHIV